MSLLILLILVGSWCAVIYYTAYYFSSSIQPNKKRQRISMAAVVVLTAFAIGDEAIGTYQFEQLCKVGGYFQIAPEAVGKKFDLIYTFTDQGLVAGNIRPVQEKRIAYIDAATGKTVAVAKAYFPKPGWMMRNHLLPSTTGGTTPLLGRDQCFPGGELGHVPPLHAITNKILN